MSAKNVVKLEGGEALPSPAVWTIADQRQRMPDVVVYRSEILSPNRSDDPGKKLTDYRGMSEFEE